MKKSLLTIVLVTMGLSSVFAQTVSLKGTVTSAEDGQPLSGVAVILEGSTKGTLTDDAGNWTLATDVGGGICYSPVWVILT